MWENHLLLFGEISARQEPDYGAVVREVLRDIGYDRPGLGLDAEHCDIQICFHPQSPDIAQGVSHRSAEDTGAGDQGIMTGYACRETPELMPLPVTLAGALVKRLDHMRRSGEMPWLLRTAKLRSAWPMRMDGPPGSPQWSFLPSIRPTFARRPCGRRCGGR